MGGIMGTIGKKVPKGIQTMRTGSCKIARQKTAKALQDIL